MQENSETEEEFCKIEKKYEKSADLTSDSGININMSDISTNVDSDDSTKIDILEIISPEHLSGSKNFNVDESGQTTQARSTIRDHGSLEKEKMHIQKSIEDKMKNKKMHIQKSIEDKMKNKKIISKKCKIILSILEIYFCCKKKKKNKK